MGAIPQKPPDHPHPPLNMFLREGREAFAGLESILKKPPCPP